MVGGIRASVFPVGCKIGDLKAKPHSVAEIITGGIFMADVMDKKKQQGTPEKDPAKFAKPCA